MKQLRHAPGPTLAEVAARAEAEAGARLSASDVLAAIDDARGGPSTAATGHRPRGAGHAAAEAVARAREIHEREGCL